MTSILDAYMCVDPSPILQVSFRFHSHLFEKLLAEISSLNKEKLFLDEDDVRIYLKTKCTVILSIRKKEIVTQSDRQNGISWKKITEVEKKQKTRES